MSDVSNNSAAGNLSAEELAARDARIELDYCAGIKPLRQIGKENGLSHTAIGKMAKERGWARNLKARIQQKADAQVAKAAVSTQVAKQKAATETQIVEANATLQKQIRLDHRQDIRRGRHLFATLMSELEETGVNVDRLEELYESLNNPPADATKAQLESINKGRELLAKVISLPARIDGAKRLTEMLEKLVKLERQAFGIADDDEGGEPGNGGAGGSARPARMLTDVERAVRLAHLLAAQAKAPPAAAPDAAAAPAAPVDRT